MHRPRDGRGCGDLRRERDRHARPLRRARRGLHAEAAFPGGAAARPGGDCGILRGLFTADGTVADYGAKSQYVAIDSSSEELLEQVQVLLLGFGIKAKLYRNRRIGSTALLPDGRGGTKEYAVEQVHSLRISRTGRQVFEREIGFAPESPKAAARRLESKGGNAAGADVRRGRVARPSRRGGCV